MAQPSSLGQPSLLLTEQDLDPFNKWIEIGRGGFAIVYKVYCRVHNGYVAVKKPHKESNQIKEIQKLVKLSNHAHVVTIKGVYLDNCIVMEYCSYSLKGLRDTLALGESYIPWPRCLYFMQHILNGMGYLHRENITHRDIKPENIMVTDTFMCKIADLGLAKQQESYSNSRSNSNIVQPSGSLFYISPERFKQPLKRASETDDIYSCAMLFYKMITNDDLFCMETLPEDESVLCNLKYYLTDLEYRHNLDIKLDKCPKPVPDIVKTVIESCWHKEPTKRKTFEHWSEHLKKYVDDKISQEELKKADEELNDLLKAGKGKSDNPKKSTDLVSKSKTRDEDRTDSVGDEEPQAVREEDTVNQRGSGDGSEYEKSSNSKTVDALDTSMRNLTVESEGIDVFVLSVTDEVAKHYNISDCMSYKLTVDKKRRELCFSDGGLSQRIPITNIKKYKAAEEEQSMTLYIGTRRKNASRQLTFSASSISRIITDLKDVGLHTSESEALPLRADDHASETISGSARRKNSLPDRCNDAAMSSNQSNQFCHSQSVPNNLHGYQWPNSPRQPHHQGGPYYGGPHQNNLRSPHSGQQPRFFPPNQPLLTSQYPTGQFASMPAQSFVSIQHVEHFHNNQYFPQSMTSPPPTIPNPPYLPNELTNSEREVDDTEDIPLLQDHVATKYDKVAAVLGMTDVGKIKLEESYNNRPEASYQLLYEWHQQNGSKATVKKLAKVLYRAGLYDAAKLLSNTTT